MLLLNTVKSDYYASFCNFLTGLMVCKGHSCKKCVVFCSCGWVWYSEGKIHDHFSLSQLTPDVRRGPKGPQQVWQVQLDKQPNNLKAPLTPTSGQRFHNTSTCADDVIFQWYSILRPQTQSVLNLLPFHLSVTSLKPLTFCCHQLQPVNTD